MKGNLFWLCVRSESLESFVRPEVFVRPTVSNEHQNRYYTEKSVRKTTQIKKRHDRHSTDYLPTYPPTLWKGLPAKISCRVWLNVWSCLSFTCPFIRRNLDRNPTAALISGFIVPRAQRVCIEKATATRLRALYLRSLSRVRLCHSADNDPCFSRV